MDELTAIFADMGFAIAEGPDIETDDYNFTKLNFPEGHPAREMHDTFFSTGSGRLAAAAHAHLAGAVRTMLAQAPIRDLPAAPIAAIRPDPSPMFHQVEGR
jgi:phenylalanyl-tRNA synthetase alpha chain